MPTARTHIKRLPKRGSYDRATLHSILDAGLICHVGFVVEGQPFVIPTAYGRVAIASTFTAPQPVGCSSRYRRASRFV